MKTHIIIIISTIMCIAACTREKTADNSDNYKFSIMTLEPGHFHAALVQKFELPDVDPKVFVYAPESPELQDHLARIRTFNTRQDNPTSWIQEVYTGSDYFMKMITDKPGNIMVIAGNNANKTSYIRQTVDAGIHVLADKPMAINPAQFLVLQDAFDLAEKNNVLLYDIMTERYEITTMLQKELSQVPDLFGELEKGSRNEPAVTKESVHHFFKFVSGSPLKRPAWFFDVTQQGEGIVDVTTHLVDLIQWECFPEQIIDYKTDIGLLDARRWATLLTPSMFAKVTQIDAYPGYLEKDIVRDSVLNVYSNGEINYTLKGVHARVSVIWNFEAPEGAQDTHYSIMRGSKANLVIRQGKEENYKATLYVEPVGNRSMADLQKSLVNAIAGLQTTYPGIAVEADGGKLTIGIPDSYNVGHEAHFSQVTEKYLGFLNDGKLPDWEVPNMIAKYYTTTKAWELSR